MSSRREVLIRILALLQRKTLIETKNRTLKCLKWHYLTVQSMKNVAVLTEDGAFALFFHPHPRGFDSSRVPTHGNLPSKAKKMLIGWGRRGWVPVDWLMHKLEIVVFLLVLTPEGYFIFHKWPRWSEDFWGGVEIFYSGIFWLGKFDKFFWGVAWFKKRDFLRNFLGYSKLSEDSW